MAAVIVLPQMPAILVRIVMELILRPVQDGWQSLRHGIVSSFHKLSCEGESLFANSDEI